MATPQDQTIEIDGKPYTLRSLDYDEATRDYEIIREDGELLHRWHAKRGEGFVQAAATAGDWLGRRPTIRGKREDPDDGEGEEGEAGPDDNGSR